MYWKLVTPSDAPIAELIFCFVLPVEFYKKYLWVVLIGGFKKWKHPAILTSKNIVIFDRFGYSSIKIFFSQSTLKIYNLIENV